MSVPAADKYLQAVQHPALAFADPPLASGRAVAGKWGLPDVQTGNFAAVFRMDAQGSLWAVRCFLREPPKNAKHRYSEIARYLKHQGDAFLVPIEYLEEGIKVDGRTLPLVVMPWVDGTPINDWVRSRLGEAGGIERLRTAFRQMTLRLGHNGVAHGDLQHGNILVAPDGTLRLLDYDGMFLPAFAGAAMPELGHPNYQHPSRARTAYGPELDRFGAIVIWTALRAVEVEPGLWDRYDTGDNLLFTSKDFARPEGSQLLKELDATTALKGHSIHLRELLAADPNSVPTLDTFISGEFRVATEPVSVRIGPMAAYPILDLRHREVSQPIGTRVIAVGEVEEVRSGRTVNGDPYRFIRFGSHHGSTLKAVLWSEILPRPADRLLPKVGDVIAVTGVLSVFAAQRQIVLERLALLERLTPDRTTELLGTRWGEAPPADTVDSELRDGDVVEHRNYGQGVVVAVNGETATIQFNDRPRRIKTGTIALRVVSHARRQRQLTSAQEEPTGLPPSTVARPASGDKHPTHAADALSRFFGVAGAAKATAQPVPSQTVGVRTGSASQRTDVAPAQTPVKAPTPAFGMFDLPAPYGGTAAPTPAGIEPHRHRRLDRRYVVLATIVLIPLVILMLSTGSGP